jgi:hypothetical protein
VLCIFDFFKSIAGKLLDQYHLADLLEDDLFETD